MVDTARRVVRGDLLYRVLDVAVMAVVALCAAILLLPDTDIPLGPAGTLRLSGINNPLIVALSLLLLMRILFPGRPAKVIAMGERIHRAMSSWKHPGLFLLVIGFTMQFLFFHSPADVVGDGLGYYAYVRSVLLQGDIDFVDEFRDHLYGARGLPDYRVKTPTGLVGNPFSIGPAVLWAPFFMAGHVATFFTDDERSGYSRPYIEAVLIGTQIFALAGILLTYRIVRRLLPDAPAFAAVLGLWLASPLVDYFKREGSMSHAHSVFAVSLFLYLFIRSAGRRTPLGWIALGAAGGLVFLVRWQDATFCLLPAIDLVAGKRFREALGDAYLYASSFLLVALPQLLVFKILYGGWLTIPQGGNFINLVPTFTWEVLFSTNHGLLLWHPVFVICLVGLIWGFKQGLPHFHLMLAGFLMQLFVNASISQWWAGHAYGGRRFLGCFSLMAVGLAAALNHPWLKGRRGFALVAACVALNYVLFVAWVWNFIPHEGIVSLSELGIGLMQAAMRPGSKTLLIILLASVLWLTSPQRAAASDSKPTTA